MSGIYFFIFGVYNTLNEEEKKAIRDVTVEQLLSWRVIGVRNGKYYPNNAYAILTGDYRVPNTIQCGVFKGSTKAILWIAKNTPARHGNL